MKNFDPVLFSDISCKILLTSAGDLLFKQEKDRFSKPIVFDQIKNFKLDNSDFLSKELKFEELNLGNSIAVSQEKIVFKELLSPFHYLSFSESVLKSKFAAEENTPFSQLCGAQYLFSTHLRYLNEKDVWNGLKNFYIFLLDESLIFVIENVLLNQKMYCVVDEKDCNYFISNLDKNMSLSDIGNKVKTLKSTLLLNHVLDSKETLIPKHPKI